jgi:cytochrome c oxidase assembly factor CtaG
VINTKRVLLLLPLYLVWVIAVDVLFASASPASSTSVPSWMVVGFVVSPLAVAGIVLWYLVRRASGEVPQQRHHTYMALLVAIMVSGFVSDALKGVASLLLGGHPWWVLVPIYTIGYAVCWAVLVYTANVLGRRDRNVDQSALVSRVRPGGDRTVDM